MLENLRDKIITVQHDLSASLRNLTTGDAPSQRSRYLGSNQTITLNAGADLLHYYQNKWEELHKNDEDNAKKAEEVDRMIVDLHKHCQQHLSIIQQLNTQLNLMPKLQSSILALMSKIGELEGLFEEVEDSLLNLEDIIQTQNLQEKQLDQRFQLALYKERKLAEFDEIKVKLADDHAHRVVEFERKHQAVLKERQDAFREAFEEEMQHYKTHGRIERVSSSSSADNPVQLADIELDNDDDDHEALNAFLAEEATEEAFSTQSPGISNEDTETEEKSSVQDK